jgi:Concanavalin A-like lectin/glucanases superfamily/Bacterial Ig domain/Abnormal spindle-like microcephaly-assoc'd, ASPM-SPD-2-Hydin
MSATNVRAATRCGGLGLLLTGVLLMPALGRAGILDASWTAPTTNTDGSALQDLASYRVYYGISPSPCAGSAFVSVASPTSRPGSNQTVSYRLTSLVTGTVYYVAVSAVDTSGNQSACSPSASAAARSDFGVSPTGTVNFGSVAPGSFAEQVFTVSNTGGGTVSGAASVTAPFSVVSGSPFTLNGAGTTQIVTVRFTPTIATTVSTTINFTANGGSISRIVTGSGTGSDTTKPTVAITSPTASAAYSTGSASLVLQGTAADDVGVTQVTWANSRGGSGTATGTASWTAAGVTLQAGTNVLTVTARDAGGNTGTATLTVTYAASDTTAPTVQVTAPGAGATVSGTISVTATAADNVGVVGVQFLLDGAALGAEQTTAPYGVAWATGSVANGTHSLSARARDAAGNTTLAASVVVTVANTQVSNTQPSGLVAAYGFAEGAGPTVADSSGNGNAGTISGATWTTQGKFGSALVFGGTTAVVTVPDAASLRLTTGMTLEAWVYPTWALTNWSTVVMKEQPGALVYTLYAGSPANRPNVYLNTATDASGERGSTGPSALPLNTWSHLAGTYDGATLRLYLNGVLVASQAVTGAMVSSTGALRIGGNGVWGEYFGGRIDEVRIYNRALSAAEIQRDMTTPVGGPP